MAKAQSNNHALKVGVISFSGNSGKTTLSTYLLAPRMQDAVRIAIETINADEGSSGEVVRGKDFNQVQENLLVHEAVIVDIGASNVEETIKQMQQFRGSHEDFDMFVIPAVNEAKNFRDTISTISTLRAMGVPSKKIRVVFNKIELDSNLEADFLPLFNYHAAEGQFVLDTRAVVYASTLFSDLRNKKTTPQELVADDTDWKKRLGEAKAAGDNDGMNEAITRIAMRRQALSVVENLDSVFSVLVNAK